MLYLKQLLADVGLKQSELAREMKVSPATISLIVSHDQWPKKNSGDLKRRVRLFLVCHGASEPAVSKAFDTANPVTDARQGSDNATINCKEIDDMLLRKYVLTPAAKRTFGFVRDPFAEVQSSDQVFMTPDGRYVREALRSTARLGGFIAVVGESGSGKSTLRRDLLDWIHNNNQQVVVIEPYVLGMEDNDIKGKSLKAGHIAEAIMAEVATGQPIKRSPEARFRQVHHALRESHRAGNKHVLIIEEAHSLPIPTLKHLKRFYELEDGFSKLLSIVLVGQSELAHKLDERNPGVREVVQRCELVTLQPLGGELEGYLSHRFELAGKPLGAVMDADAVEALRNKLSGRDHSVLYPLAVHNVLTAAMNEAAEIGMTELNADLIRGV